MEEPSVKIYLIEPVGGGFYYATQNPDGTFHVAPPVSPIGDPPAIMTLPSGWKDINIKWDRDMTFLGVFTTQAQTLKFVQDARAILLSLYYAANGGIQASCLMRVDVFIDVFTGYQTTYECEIDFSKAVDQKYNGITGGIGLPPVAGEFAVPTLNAKLNELVTAYGDTEFNIPMWVNTAPAGSPAAWVTDAIFIMHTGIKLRYQTDYTGSMDTTKPLTVQLYGFAGGAHGSFSSNGYPGHYQLNAGTHFLPSLNQFTITQNNGDTTFIGNDILQKYLIVTNQGQSGTGTSSEITFSDQNNSRPYSRNAYLIKDLLVDYNQNGLSVDTYLKLAVKFAGTSFFAYAIPDIILKFVLFEIDEFDQPALSGGQYSFELLFSLAITDGSGVVIPGCLVDFDVTNFVTLKYSKCYVIGIICDQITPVTAFEPSIGGSPMLQFDIISMLPTFCAQYNNGGAGSSTGPAGLIDAPRLPASPIMGFTAGQLLDKIVPMLNSESTDQYGFPIVPAGTPFTGVSTFLNTDAFSFDNSPTRTLFFSSNALQVLTGYPYITMSLNKLFKTCFQTWGCGGAIQGDTFVIEKLESFFQDVEILALGENVASMKIEPLTDIMNCFLQCGYTSQDVNNDFGVERAWDEINFNTPLTKVPGTTLSIINDVIANMYAMEKRRAQQVNSAVPNSANGQSNGNETYMVEFDPFQAWTGGFISPPFPDGLGTLPPLIPTVVTQFPGAQNTNATLVDYIYGMFYPDTAINLGITPLKNMYRLGAYLRSMLDNQDSKNLIFRNVYQMLINNIADLIPGIKTADLGGRGTPVIIENADLPIANLQSNLYPADYPYKQLFRPFEISIKTVAPVNMWNIMATNPNGYISWIWKRLFWKGYVRSTNQNIALSKPTDFVLWAHPSITNAMLINS